MKFLESFFPRQVTLKDNSTYPSLNFGEFIKLEKLKIDFNDSLQKRNKSKFIRTVGDILNLQTKKTIKLENLADILSDCLTIFGENTLARKLDVVFLQPPPKDPNRKEVKKDKDRWDFDNRWIAQWIDLLATNYHWSLSEILSLDLNNLVYYVQEILVNEQLEREWQYGLTENAYQYDKNSNTSKFVPLKRPYWMDNNVDSVIKKTKIRRDMLPYGVVENLSGMETMTGNINETLSEEKSPEN